MAPVSKSGRVFGRPDDPAGGYALPSVLATLVLLSLLAVASFHSSRLDALAVSSLAASIRAFHAAEAGLALLRAGHASGTDTLSVPGARIVTRRERLLVLEDGTRIVRLSAEAVARDGRGIGTRRVSVLRLRPDAGPELPVAGSWRETFRP